MMIKDYRYLIALGSNRRHLRYGGPRHVIREALRVLDNAPISVESVSRILDTPALGPSRRRFANAVVIIRTDLDPESLLSRLKQVERDFGRPSHAPRWSARVLDLDIILWSGGAFAASRLVIPHVAFRLRPFVLAPAMDVARNWRDPLTRLSIAQLYFRFTRPVGV